MENQTSLTRPEQVQQNTTKKELYCICYERIFRDSRGDVVRIEPRTDYRHALDDKEAKVEFTKSAPSNFVIGRDFRIVEVARALGAFYKLGEEDKLNSIAEIE